VYHDIADVSRAADPLRLTVPPALFDEHVRQLRESRVPILTLHEAAAQLAGGTLTEPGAVITFDDGYVSFMTEALPILRHYDAPATLFVTSGALDTPRFTFNRPGPFTRPMTWRELTDAASTPGIDIGSHTMTHPRVHELTPDERRDELVRSRDQLESRLGRPVHAFAYPFGGWGTFPPAVQEDVRAAGYTIACANVMGPNLPDTNPFALCRTRLGWEDSSRRFRAKLAGAYDWTDRIRKT
jgi:peptidoglycan/xylan/chitin deacetylase (PgdA/CDA1 family)